jgi:hypothetical protein
MVRVGDCGRTASSLHPQGFVRINGRRYDARSEWNPIEQGCEVVVVGGDLQGLIVRKVIPGLAPDRLPNYAKPVHSSFGELLDLQQRQAEAERETWQSGLPRWRAARRAYGLRMGALLGAMFAAGGLAVSWWYVTQASQTPWLTALAVAGVGAFWGVVVFLLLDFTHQRLLRQMLPRLEGRVYDRITLCATGFALLGTTVAAALVVPWLGVEAGVVAALPATGALGLVVPCVLLVNAAPDE